MKTERVINTCSGLELATSSLRDISGEKGDETCTAVGALSLTPNTINPSAQSRASLSYILNKSNA